MGRKIWQLDREEGECASTFWRVAASLVIDASITTRLRARITTRLRARMSANTSCRDTAGLETDASMSIRPLGQQERLVEGEQREDHTTTKEVRQFQ